MSFEARPLSRQPSWRIAPITPKGRWPLLRTLIGVLLLAAAALKGHQLATSPLPPTAVLDRPSSVVLIELELLLALWLLCGGWARAAWTICVALFGVFAAYSLWRLIAGADSCGCFGAAAVPPAATLTLDLLVLAGLTACRPTGNSAPARMRVGLASVLAAAIGIPAAWATTSYRSAPLDAVGGVVLLEPQDWIGTPFPLAGRIDTAADVASGRWSVVLHRSTCDRCMDRVAQCERLPAAGAERVLLVSVPPYVLGGPPHDGSSPVVHGRLPTDTQWVVEVPALVRLEDGVVVAAGGDDLLAECLRSLGAGAVPPLVHAGGER